MREWTNRFRRLPNESGLQVEGKPDREIVHEFRCHCAPDSRLHERMVRGALRNMSEDFYLEDGVAIQEVPAT